MRQKFLIVLVERLQKRAITAHEYYLQVIFYKLLLNLTHQENCFNFPFCSTRMEQDLKSKIDQACRVAEEFTKLYYESLDKRRYLISRLYLDTASLIWNGNGVEGKDAIQKFWIDLPASDHVFNTLDAQPITGSAVSDQLTFLVKVSGQVKYQDKTSRPFTQNFLITAVGDKWKIVSDCFRMQDTLESP